MQRRQLLQAAPAGLIGAMLAQWGVGTADAATGNIALAFPFDVENWDPTSRVIPAASSLFKCVFDQPLEYSADSQLSPGVVKHFEWLDKKGLVLALDFRDDVYFHNGDKLTSTDFKFTFLERPRADKTLQLGYIWGGIQSIDTPSPTRAVIHFSKPMVTAPQYLGFAGSFILPKAYFQKVGPAGFLAKPVGSGPYRLVEYQRDSRIVLEAFDKYWGGVPQLPRVTIQVVKDASARVSAVQSGQVALTFSLPIRETVRMSTLPQLSSELQPTVDTYLIHMVNKGPLQDKNVRLAMHHAIDKQALAKALFNGVNAPLAQASPPGTPAFDPSITFNHDPEAAKKLLAQSGYGPDKPVRFTFLCTNGVYPADYDMARAIVQMWKKVGIEVQLKTIELAQYFPAAAAGTLEGPTLWFWTNSTADPELYAGSYLDPNTAFSVWRSADVGQKLAPLLVELDYNKRIEGYKAFDRWAVEQGYSLPLLQGVSTVTRARSLKGFRPYRNGWILPAHWTA